MNYGIRNIFFIFVGLALAFSPEPYVRGFLALVPPVGRSKADGLLPAGKFAELLGHSIMPEEDAGRYHTVAGFVLFHLNRIPKTGSRLEWSGYQFEVLDMDGNRIDKLLVTPPKSPNSQL